MPIPLSLIGSRHYAVLLAGVVVTLFCMALPWPLDITASFGFTLVILLQIRLLVGIGPHGILSRLFRLVGWLSVAALWVWLLSPHFMRVSGVPVLLVWLLFQVQAYLRLIQRLSRERRVTGDVLAGALAGYLLLGLTAGLVTALLESISPGSFQGLLPPGAELTTGGPETMSLQQTRFVHVSYFAFVTLTTLGYGDMLPITPLARISSIIFSVVGPFYLAVVMGLLIGRYIQQEQVDP